MELPTICMIYWYSIGILLVYSWYSIGILFFITSGYRDCVKKALRQCYTFCN
jgi:hypothetical protein